MNFRRLRTLMQREVRATLRNPFTVGILITVPLVALLMFGYILSTEVHGLDLGVLDLSQSPASRQLVSDVIANQTFIAHPYRSRDEIEAGLVSGAISAAILIPPDYDDREIGRDGEGPPRVQVLFDGAEAVLAGNAEGFLRGLMLASASRRQSSASAALAPVGSGAELRASRPGGVRVVTHALFNPRFEGKPFMVSGTFGFVLSFLTVLLTAVSIVTERLTGTFEQLQVTPATGLEILLGKILPLGAIFTFDVILMVLVAGFVIGVWPVGSVVFFILVSAFYVLVSLALGVIISVTSATAAEAVQKSVMFSVPLVQLSGFAFPIRNMPAPVQWVSEIFPATHYIRVARAIYIRGDGFLALAPELALLTGFGALLVFYALGRIEARA